MFLFVKTCDRLKSVSRTYLVRRLNWLLARRTEAKKAIERGIDRGELRLGLDLEVGIDEIYFQANPQQN